MPLRLASPAGKRSVAEASSSLVLHSARGEHDYGSRDPVLLARGVDVYDSSDAVPTTAEHDPGHGAHRPDLHARLHRPWQIGDQRVGQGADRAARVAPAVIRDGVDRLRQWRRPQSGRLEAPEQPSGPAPTPRAAASNMGRPPAATPPPPRRPRFRLGAGPGRRRPQVFVVDRPVLTAPVQGLHAEVLMMQPEPAGVVVQRRPAEAVASVEPDVDRLRSSGGSAPCIPLQPACPDGRADQVAELPARPGFEHQDAPAFGREFRRDQASGRAGADNHCVEARVHHQFLCGGIWGI